MSSQVDQVIDEALALTAEERSEVALVLLDSLVGEEEATVAKAWAEEIRLRRQQLRTGVTQAVPWAEARARLAAL